MHATLDELWVVFDRALEIAKENPTLFLTECVDLANEETKMGLLATEVDFVWLEVVKAIEG